MPVERTAKQHRKTRETDISLTLNLDGSGTSQLNTGIGFLIICWMDLPATVFLI